MLLATGEVHNTLDFVTLDSLTPTRSDSVSLQVAYNLVTPGTCCRVDRIVHVVEGVPAV